MTVAPLEARIKQRALELGFALAGIAPATPADGFAHLADWLARGFAGEMTYMERHGAARRHPAAVLPTVRSVVMVAMNYGSPPSAEPAGLHGRVARYAGGADYHDVLRGKLNELLAWVQTEVPGTQGRGVVDTAPLLERDFARRAGLGWFGKNTMLIHKRLGSYTLLGALLLDRALTADAPFETSHCGTCTRCLDACPTDAFTGPFQLDARRCISYLTIELRGAIAPSCAPASATGCSAATFARRCVRGTARRRRARSRRWRRGRWDGRWISSNCSDCRRTSFAGVSAAPPCGAPGAAVCCATPRSRWATSATHARCRH